MTDWQFHDALRRLVVGHAGYGSPFLELFDRLYPAPTAAIE